MTKFYDATILFLFLASALNGQWDIYQANWQGKSGSVVVNMDWIKFAPVDELPFLMIVETALDSCDEQGFGYEAERQLIAHNYTSIDSLVSLYNYIESVGNFSHDCMSREYYYLRDSVGVRSRVTQLVSKNYTIKIISDTKWLGYLEFLYPDDFLIQTMVNRKVIDELVLADVDLTKKRSLTHFAAFASEKERDNYRKAIQSRGFNVVDLIYEIKEVLPYQIMFIRKDHLDLKWISDITLNLAQEAELHEGYYDGWEITIDE